MMMSFSWNVMQHYLRDGRTISLLDSVRPFRSATIPAFKKFDENGDTRRRACVHELALVPQRPRPVQKEVDQRRLRIRGQRHDQKPCTIRGRVEHRNIVVRIQSRRD